MAQVLSSAATTGDTWQPLEVAAAYDDCFDALFAVAYRVAFKMLGQREDAEDIAESVLEKAWPRWDTIVDYAPAWVGRASINATTSLCRRRTRFERLPLVATPASTTSNEQQNGAIRAELVRALLRLSRRQREVIGLRYFLDLTLVDIGAVLGCTEGSVKSRVSRALDALRNDPRLIGMEW